jgi:hypothetical protein
MASNLRLHDSRRHTDSTWIRSSSAGTGGKCRPRSSSSSTFFVAGLFNRSGLTAQPTVASRTPNTPIFLRTLSLLTESSASLQSLSSWTIRSLFSEGSTRETLTIPISSCCALVSATGEQATNTGGSLPVVPGNERRAGGAHSGRTSEGTGHDCLEKAKDRI